MNELQIFDNSEFGKIRTLEQDGKILFCGSDAAKALGYCNPHDAMIRHCKEHGVVKHEVIDILGRAQQARFITEGNLYRLITHSKLESAEKFERWVFDEVLPSIRKTGSYQQPIENFSTFDMIKLQNQALFELDERMVVLEEKVGKQITLDHAQQRALQNNVTKRVYARAFDCAHNRTSDIQPIDIKANINKFFKAIYRDLKNQFGVTSYRDISANDFTSAIQCVQAWIEPTELRERVG